MNHSNDHFDGVIDRVARQLVEHDPPQRLHAAVMSEIRAHGQRRRPSWLQWLLMAPAAALVIVALVLWSQPRQDLELEAPTQPQIVAEAPAPTESQVPPSATPARPRRERGPVAIISPPVVAEPESPIPAIDVGEIRVESVRVVTIDANPLAIPAIRISNIDIDSP